MVKIMLLLHRRPGTSVDEFRQYASRAEGHDRAEGRIDPPPHESFNAIRDRLCNKDALRSRQR